MKMFKECLVTNIIRALKFTCSISTHEEHFESGKASPLFIDWWTARWFSSFPRRWYCFGWGDVVGSERREHLASFFQSPEKYWEFPRLLITWEFFSKAAGFPPCSKVSKVTWNASLSKEKRCSLCKGGNPHSPVVASQANCGGGNTVSFSEGRGAPSSSDYFENFKDPFCLAPTCYLFHTVSLTELRNLNAWMKAVGT